MSKEEKAWFYFYVESSIGTLPVKVFIEDIQDQGEEEGMQLTIDYFIDSEHEKCPELGNMPKDEAMSIMTQLKTELPKRIEKILEEEAQKVLDKDES